MVKVYMHWLSSPCRTTIMTCEIIGLKPEYQVVDLMKGEQKKPEFLKINPDHCVPTLVDGDFVLWESRPLAIYLVDKYAPGHALFPKDIQKRALIHKMLDIDMSKIYKAIGTYVYPRAFQGKDSSPDEMEAMFKYMEDTILTESPYIVGDTLTLADLFIISSVTFPEVVGYEVSAANFPKLAAWIKRIKSSEFYEKANVHFEEIKKSMLKK